MESYITPERLESVKRELFLALQSKYSLQYYLRLVCSAIQMRLTLCDTSFGVLAAAPDDIIQDPENVEMVNGKQYIRFDATKELDKSRHLERLMEAHRPYTFWDPKFPNEILFRSVRINQAVVAYIFCPGRPEGFTPGDLELIDYLGQILSIEMQKNSGFEAESGLKYEYYLQELASGRFNSDVFAEQRLRQLNRNPQPYYYMLYFSFDEPESRYSVGGRYFDPLLSIFPEGLVGGVSGRLCLLLPRDKPKPLSDRERQSLLIFLKLNRMRCGVSYCYTSLIMSSYAIEQAEASVRAPFGEERIYSYEREYLRHVFSQGKSRDWLQSQILPELRLLRQYDGIHRTEFLDTLRTYILCSRNAAKAAANLHIHKSTFFYRMNKIADLLETDIYDGSWLFACEFSFCLMDYLKRESGTEESMS